MDISRRRLLINAAAGAGQALASGIILLALYRILIERLGPEQVGAWSLLLAWLTLGRLADLGLPGGMVRFAASAFASGEAHRAILILRNGMLLACGLTAVAIGVMVLILVMHVPGFLTAQPDVAQLLIWSGLVTWLGCVAISIRAGLDALQRADLRHGTMIMQNILLLCGVLLLVKDNDLVGLLISQAIAIGVTVTITACILVSALLQRWPAVTRSNNETTGKGSVRSLLRYGLTFQATTIISLLLEPTVKLLIGTFSGLSSVAWYEMASRLITQVRAVIVNAMESLVPHVAGLPDGQRRETLYQDYRRVFGANLAFVSLGMGLVVTNLPVIGLLWIGTSEPQFLCFAFMLAIAWWFNSLTVPAYFVAQGLGIQRWGLLGQSAMAVINLVVGIALGIISGGIGVAAAFSFALIFGSFVTLVGIHREITMITNQVVAASIPWSYAIFAIVAGSPLALARGTTTMPGLFAISLPATVAVVVVFVCMRSNRELIRWLFLRLGFFPARANRGDI